MLLCIGHDTRLTHDHFMTNVMLVLSPINKSTGDKLNHLKILYSYGLSFQQWYSQKKKKKNSNVTNIINFTIIEVINCD